MAPPAGELASLCSALVLLLALMPLPLLGLGLALALARHTTDVGLAKSTGLGLREARRGTSLLAVLLVPPSLSGAPQSIAFAFARQKLALSSARSSANSPSDQWQ